MTDDRSDDLIRKPTPRAPPPSNDELIRARQLGRAKVMAWLLGGLVILLFFVAMAKIKAGMGQ